MDGWIYISIDHLGGGGMVVVVIEVRSSLIYCDARRDFTWRDASSFSNDFVLHFSFYILYFNS